MRLTRVSSIPPFSGVEDHGTKHPTGSKTGEATDGNEDERTQPPANQSQAGDLVQIQLSRKHWVRASFSARSSPRAGIAFARDTSGRPGVEGGRHAQAHRRSTPDCSTSGTPIRRGIGSAGRLAVRRPTVGSNPESADQKERTDRVPRVGASTVSFVQYGSAYPHRISAPYEPWMFLICSNNGRSPPGNTSPIPVFPRNWES